MHRHHILLAAICVLSVESALAQQTQPRAQSPTEVLRSIQQSSGDIEQLRSGLHSPDPSVRVSTFAAMINSNNPSLVTVAINEGHVSSDAALRDLAARAAFRELQAFQIEPNGEVSSDNQAAFVGFSNDYGLRARITAYDWGTGRFTIAGGGPSQISGSRLSFRTAYCQGTLAAVEGSWTYDGVVVCSNGPKLTGRMHISIR